jgi:uncharacterized membrane protein YjgN (DUF898 family)
MFWTVYTLTREEEEKRSLTATNLTFNRSRFHLKRKKKHIFKTVLKVAAAVVMQITIIIIIINILPIF